MPNQHFRDPKHKNHREIVGVVLENFTWEIPEFFRDHSNVSI
jgi:hypothetical protein